MARDASITLEQVQTAVEAIRADGGKPTLRAVRERLGTGSMGTIANFMQELGARKNSGELPPSIPQTLQRALFDFVAAETASIRGPLDAALAEQRQFALELAAEGERLTAMIESQSHEMATLSAAKAAAEGRAGQLASDLTDARAEAAIQRRTAEDLRTELAKATLRLEALASLQAERDALRQELTAERQARVDAEKQAAVLEALAERKA